METYIMASSITSAIQTLEELGSILDKAYWEVSAINAKDAIYDCISALNKELSELNKLSIQDHDLIYEPISYEFKGITRRLSVFRKYLDNYIMRAATIETLDRSILSTLQLINQEPKRADE